MKRGWEADPTVHTTQVDVVQAVAKFLRSSPRFSSILKSKAEQADIRVLANFGFAPQRFASIERPLTRFIFLATTIVEALVFDYEFHSSSKRRTWAQQILRLLHGPTWVLLGMMADLADDCVRFIRCMDKRDLNSITCACEIQRFTTHLREEYVQGKM